MSEQNSRSGPENTYKVARLHDEYARCGVCGSDMQIVRPGKWQCLKCELDEMLRRTAEEARAPLLAEVSALRAELAEERKLREELADKVDGW